MTDEERKQFAYIAGMLLKVVHGDELTLNEIQSLENIASDLRFWDIPEKHFRY